MTMIAPVSPLSAFVQENYGDRTLNRPKLFKEDELIQRAVQQLGPRIGKLK